MYADVIQVIRAQIIPTYSIEIWCRIQVLFYLPRFFNGQQKKNKNEKRETIDNDDDNYCNEPSRFSAEKERQKQNDREQHTTNTTIEYNAKIINIKII